MTDEVDMALKYAEERRMRMRLEQRVLAITGEAMFINTAAKELLTGIVTNNNHKIASQMRNIVAWSSDLDLQINLNLFAAAGKNPMISFDEFVKDEIHDYMDLPEHLRRKAETIMKKNVEATREEWDKLVMGTNIMQADESRDARIMAFVKFAVKHGFAAAKESADEDQKAETG